MAFNPITSNSTTTTKGDVLSQINQEFSDLYTELDLLQVEIEADADQKIIAAKADIAQDYYLKTQVNNFLAAKADLISGKVPANQLPDTILGQLSFQTTYNASTNTPALPAASTSKGYFWIVKTAGTVNAIGPSGSNLVLGVGDWVLSVGTHYEQVDNTDSVISVFGRLGAVTAQAGDYTADQINETTGSKIMTAAERTKLAGLAAVATSGAYTDLTGKPTIIDSTGPLSVLHLWGGTESQHTALSSKDTNTLYFLV
jgi:hypothetical protein